MAVFVRQRMSCINMTLVFIKQNILINQGKKMFFSPIIIVYWGSTLKLLVLIFLDKISVSWILNLNELNICKSNTFKLANSISVLKHPSILIYQGLFFCLWKMCSLLACPIICTLKSTLKVLLLHKSTFETHKTQKC